MIWQEPLHAVYLETNPGALPRLEAALRPMFPRLRVDWAPDLPTFQRCLEARDLDVVLAGLGDPACAVLPALETCHRLHPALPLILLCQGHGLAITLAATDPGSSPVVARGGPCHLSRVVRRALKDARLRSGARSLEARHEALRQATRSAGVVPWLHNRTTGAWVLEDACQPMFGHPPEAFALNPFLVEQLVHPEDLATLRSARQLAGLGHRIAIDCRMRRASAAWGWFRWILAEGEDGLRGVLQDLSDFQSGPIPSCQDDKAMTLSYLVSGLCHDLNNLTNSIAGCAELLATADADQERRDLAATIQQATLRIQDLLGPVLGFARRDWGAALAVRDLSDLAREASALLGPVLRRKVRFQFEADARPLPAKVNPGQVVQALMNLLINAMDAAPRLGTVRLRSGRPSSPDPGGPAEGYLEVWDSGPGIPKDLMEKIVEPFFTTKPPGKGTGLGLPMVQAIASAHGGRLEIGSDPGSGSCFRLVLPLVLPESP